MLSSLKQEQLLKGKSFSLFGSLPAEIRNQIWNISVEDYPARIVDLREHR
jgi:hypothetical protein